MLVHKNSAPNTDRLCNIEQKYLLVYDRKRLNIPDEKMLHGHDQNKLHSQPSPFMVVVKIRLYLSYFRKLNEPMFFRQL